MQTRVYINESSLKELASAVFEGEEPIVNSAYSEWGQELQRFYSPSELMTYLSNCLTTNTAFCDFAIWYPSSRGYTESKRISLDPKRCEGHTFSYRFVGWGVIHLQLNFKRKPIIECSVLVNSEKRATAWQLQDPGLGPAAAWDWKVVEKRARRLIRKAKALAQQQHSSDGSRPSDDAGR